MLLLPLPYEHTITKSVRILGSKGAAVELREYLRHPAVCLHN